MEGYFSSEAYVESHYTTTPEFKELFYNGILAKHFESVIGSITRYYPYYITQAEIDASEPSDEEVGQKVFIPFLTGLIQIYANTYPKYKAALDALNTLQTQTGGGLLKRPSSSSSSTNKYSETPQDTDNESTLLGNAHLTNVTRNESEVASDGASPAARFAEIAEKIRNIYEEWSHEFDQLFQYERGSR